MAAGAIHKETQDMHEQIFDRNPLAAFAYRTKLALNDRKQGNVTQVTGIVFLSPLLLNITTSLQGIFARLSFRPS